MDYTRDVQDSIITKLETRLTAARADVEKFRAALATDPAHAMSWSAGVFNASASIAVIPGVLNDVRSANGSDDPKSTLECVRVGVVGEIAWRARNAETSSSPTTNLMDRALLNEWAQVLAILG